MKKDVIAPPSEEMLPIGSQDPSMGCDSAMAAASHEHGYLEFDGDMVYWSKSDGSEYHSTFNAQLPCPCAVPLIQDVWISAAVDSEHSPVEFGWNPGAICHISDAS